jgi:alanine racemase
MASNLPPASSEDPAAAPARNAAVDYLDATLRPAWVRVDLDALEANYRHLAARVAPARMGAVVKADAYGHGAVRVARALEGLGVSLLCVALVEEGVELRRAGIEAPLLVMGTAQPAQLPVLRRYRLTPAVSSLAQLALWRDFAAGGAAPQPIHLEVDTGMSRLGIAPGEVAAALDLVRHTPLLELAGFMSHFGDADLPDSPRNPEQEAAFDAALALLGAEERRRAVVHLANSAAGLHRPGARFDLVRFGLALWGLDPANGVGELRPVAALATRVTQLREVPAGRAAGYGARWRAARPSRLATVPVGYADGYPWALLGRAEALLRGRRVPVAGAVSMDLTVLDVTDVPDAAEGDEVVLLGRQGEEEVTAVELAGWAGTISYEVLTRASQRLPRCYLRGGAPESVVSRFLSGSRR